MDIGTETASISDQINEYLESINKKIDHATQVFVQQFQECEPCPDTNLSLL